MSVPRTPVSLEIAPELACPRCGGSLEADSGSLRCARDGVVARIADAILEFDRSEMYWGELTQDTMHSLLADAERDGWRAAVMRHVRDPELVHYITDPTRGDWQWLLPLDRRRTIAVDVGAGLGANSFAIAPNVRRVYAVEKIAERIAFVARRAMQEGAAVVPVRADLHALPFAPASIDVFVVNGVLEWAGLVDPHPVAGRAASPRSLQEEFLRRLHTLLRPGGHIYVGIENRYGEMFWRGTPDHQGLRYTSLMPRTLARAYTFARAAAAPRTYRRERDYRTYTYSLAATRQLVESCGFEAVETWSVAPGYNVPTRIVPLADRNAMCWFAQRAHSAADLRGRARDALRRGLARSGLAAQTASCFALVARRGEAGS